MAALRQFLKLIAEYIIHLKPLCKVLGNVAVSCAMRVQVHFLKRDHIRTLGFQKVDDLLQLKSAIDVPVDRADFVGRPKCPSWTCEAAREDLPHKLITRRYRLKPIPEKQTTLQMQ